jgi:hypothetical protein
LSLVNEGLGLAGWAFADEGWSIESKPLNGASIREKMVFLALFELKIPQNCRKASQKPDKS